MGVILTDSRIKHFRYVVCFHFLRVSLKNGTRSSFTSELCFFRLLNVSVEDPLCCLQCVYFILFILLSDTPGTVTVFINSMSILTHS